MERVCERCAGDDDDLVLVRSPSGGGDGEAPAAELWCFECRSTAEHVALDDA